MCKVKKTVCALLVLSLAANIFLAWMCFTDKNPIITRTTYQTAVSAENPGIRGEYIVFENDGSSCLRYMQFDESPVTGSFKSLGECFYSIVYNDVSDERENTDYFYVRGDEIYLLSGGKMTEYTKIADVPTYINTQRPDNV